MTSSKPMVDTNVLVYAHNQDSPFFFEAKSVIKELLNKDGFCVTSLILFEFFSIITNGRKIETPLPPENAITIIQDIIDSDKIDVYPTMDDHGFFFWIVKYIHSTKRYQIYDASIAYSMHQNGIKILVTNNVKDFKRFDHMEVVSPFKKTSISVTDHTGRHIPYGRQTIDEKDVAAVCSVLRSDFLTQGPKVPEFEQTVADYCGASHGVAVNSGTSALHIACLALNLGLGDILWTSPITFVASANCALYCGAEVDFVDIDPKTYNLCPQALEEKLIAAEKACKLPKVVVPVHLCGQPCDIAAIHTLSQKYGFSIIEDASHAIGGRYKNEPIGNGRYSDITVFSFHPVKLITTGEGGMAMTNDTALANKMALLRTHGITRDPEQMTHPPHGPCYYQQIELGFNYRMTDIQAALGISQMDRLDEFVEARRRLAARYDELLAELPVTLPWQEPEGASAWHLYVIRITPETGTEKTSQNKRQKHRQVFKYLIEKQIGVNLHYIPVHLQPWYLRMGFEEGMFSEAEKYYREAITLPLFPAMTKEQQDTVIAVLKKALQE